jgi:hypothetical protein
MILLLHFWIIICIGQIYYDFINSRIDHGLFLRIIITIIIYVAYFWGANEIRKIIISINKTEIIFYYRLIPFRKIIKIKIDVIKEISINHTSNNYDGYTFYKVKEKIYNVDLIDNELNSYRIYQSTAYNEDLINLSQNIGSIINKKINDQNNKEGYKNIYKKRII